MREGDWSNKFRNLGLSAKSVNVTVEYFWNFEFIFLLFVHWHITIDTNTKVK